MKGFYGWSLKRRSTDAMILSEKDVDPRERARSLVSRLLQQFKEIKDGGRKKRKEVVQFHRSTAVTELVEKGVESRTFEMHSR